MQLITRVINRCGDIKFFFFHNHLSFLHFSNRYKIKKPPFLSKDGLYRVTTLLYLFFTKKTSIGRQMPTLTRSRAHPSQPMPLLVYSWRQSVRSSKAMFYDCAAPLFSLPRLSVAYCIPCTLLFTAFLLIPCIVLYFPVCCQLIPEKTHFYILYPQLFSIAQYGFWYQQNIPLLCPLVPKVQILLLGLPDRQNHTYRCHFVQYRLVPAVQYWYLAVLSNHQ